MSKATLTRLAHRAERLRTKTDELTYVRDEAIREAYAEGEAVTSIAKAAGLTRQRVYQIIKPPLTTYSRPRRGSVGGP